MSYAVRMRRNRSKVGVLPSLAFINHRAFQGETTTLRFAPDGTISTAVAGGLNPALTVQNNGGAVIAERFTETGSVGLNWWLYLEHTGGGGIGTFTGNVGSWQQINVNRDYTLVRNLSSPTAALSYNCYIAPLPTFDIAYLSFLTFTKVFFGG